MQTNSDCPFCAMGSGTRDSDLVAFRTERVFVVTALKQRRSNPGHVLVCPVAHETSLHALESSLLAEVAGVVARVSGAALAAFQAMGTTILINVSAPDQVLAHLHVHVIPRFADDALVIPNTDQTPAPRALRLRLAADLRGLLRAQKA